MEVCTRQYTVSASGGAIMKKKKLGVSNTPYDGGRWVTDSGWWVTDGGWWVTDGGWWVTDGGWCVTDGGWWVTDGGWCVTDGGWWVTDGGWWVATKHQRVDAIVTKKKGECPYGTPCSACGEETSQGGRGPPHPAPRVRLVVAVCTVQVREQHSEGGTETEKGGG